MSGDELSYVPSIMNYNPNGHNLASGVVSINQQNQTGSKRFSRRPRAMLDKQVILKENREAVGVYNYDKKYHNANDFNHFIIAAERKQ